MRLHHALILSLLFGTSLSACDDKSAETKKAESKGKTDAKAGAKAADGKAGNAKAADAKAVDTKAVDTKAVDTKADDAKAVDAKAVDTKAAATPPAPPAPTTAEEAARQLAAWLSDPTKAGVPPLLAAAGDVEIAEFCGACDDTKKAKSSKHSGVDAMTKKADELRTSAAAEVISAEEKVECNDNCCTFAPEKGVGVGDNVVNVEKVCVALDKDKKPTAYTKIETSGSY